MTVSWSGLRAHEVGGGVVSSEQESNLFRMTIPPKPQGYANAQLDDYAQLRREAFPWAPPVRLRLRARASNPEPSGTLGFGFWNDPFSFSLGFADAARRWPASPQALWFFYGSPPNNLSFTEGLSGHGWKASSLRTPRLPPALLAPLAAGAAALARIPGVRRPVLRAVLRQARAAEAMLPVALNEWHTYELEWAQDHATFRVDGQHVLTADDPPAPPLGFVTWIDNQFAVASPDIGLRFGVVPTESDQWLEVAEMRLERL